MQRAAYGPELPPPPTGYYRCTICHRDLPYDREHFHRHHRGALTSRCKSCASRQVQDLRHNGLTSPAKHGTRYMAYEHYLERIRSGEIAVPWVDVLLRVQDYFEANPAPRVTIIPARAVTS